VGISRSPDYRRSRENNNGERKKEGGRRKGENSLQKKKEKKGGTNEARKIFQNSREGIIGIGTPGMGGKEVFEGKSSCTNQEASGGTTGAEGWEKKRREEELGYLKKLQGEKKKVS